MDHMKATRQECSVIYCSSPVFVKSSHFSIKDKRGTKTFFGFDGYNKNARIKFSVYFYPGMLFKI